MKLEILHTNVCKIMHYSAQHFPLHNKTTEGNNQVQIEQSGKSLIHAQPGL